MNRIVFACQSLTGGNGGIARVDRLIRAVLKEKYDQSRVEVHVFSDARGDDATVDLRFPVRYYGSSRLRFAAGLWYSMRAPGYWIYDAAYLARVHPRHGFGRTRPFMIFLHGIEVWEDARPSSIEACRRAHRLVSNSDYTLSRAQRCHGAFRNARACWLGTESDAKPMPVPALSCAMPPTVLVVGRMDIREGYKGHDDVIRAWPDVLRAHPMARLEIVGRGSLLPALQQLASDCGVAGQVVFRGFVSEAELADCYARAQVFALPSRGEGFGLVYIEAMRHGLPIVASRHDAGAEVVVDMKTGLLADLALTGDLAAKLTWLLTNRDAAEAMGLAGQRRWQELFTYSAFKVRFSEVLDQALSAKTQ